MIAATFVPTANFPSDTLQTSNRLVLGPVAFAHVRLGVVQARDPHLDGSMARFWLQFREVLEDESFSSTKVIVNDRFRVVNTHHAS